MSHNDVTIDTNVFEHLFNPQNNVQDHIDTLLGRLVEKGVVLCVDNKGRIFGEYDNRLKPLFKAMSDQGQRLFWLRYFLWTQNPIVFLSVSETPSWSQSGGELAWGRSLATVSSFMWLLPQTRSLFQMTRIISLTIALG